MILSSLSIAEIAPRSGTAFRIAHGQILKVIDPQGEQVSDLLAYNAHDTREAISNGRTFDYEQTICLSTGNRLWSNRSNPMFEIIEDKVGRHDFLLTPCSEATFRRFHADKPVHRGCFGNLAEALARYGIAPSDIPCAFNIFMNVPVDGRSGRLRIVPPISKPGDFIRLRAQMDLIIGLTACPAYSSSGGSCKPIHYAVED